MPYLVSSDSPHKPAVGAGINWGHPLSSGLLGAWAFNEGAGGVVNDSIRSGSRLSAINGPTWTATQNGAGMRFVAASLQYLQVSDSTPLVLTYDCTIVWYGIKNSSTTASYNNIWGINKLFLGSSPTLCEWALGIGDGNLGNADLMEFSLYMGAVNNGFRSALAMPVGSLTHVCGVRRGSIMYLFRNGVQDVNTLNCGAGAINNAGRNVRIAHNDDPSGNLYTDCTVSMAAVWNRALTPDEVKAHAANPYCIFGAVSPLNRIATAYPLPAARTLSPRFLFFDVGEHRT